MYLYSILLIASLIVPLGLSFDSKQQFYRNWPALFISIVLVALFFLLADIYMTVNGVWGFNNSYHSSILIWNLPLEEWFFFVVIPYASIFLHESIILYFPHFKVGRFVARIVYRALLLTSIVMILLFWDRLYTAYAFGLLAISSIWSLIDKGVLLEQYLITFLVILIPFIAVNSILTGSFIADEVVWYNNNENLSLRLLTIPIEDFAYGFSLILFNMLIFNKLRSLKWLLF